MFRPLHISPVGRAKLVAFEGFSDTAYRDVVGVWTIGYGFTEGVREGDTLTRVQADSLLTHALMRYENAVERACIVTPTQTQFDAMVSLAWNIGIAGFEKSTVLACHNRNDFPAAARAFGLWNKAGGKVWPGLVRRRAAEAAWYLQPAPYDVSDAETGPAHEMPQAVDPERPMSQSTINRGSVVAGGTAALATVSETARIASDTRYSLQSLLGEWALPVLMGLTLVACGYILWQRYAQRHDGVA